MNENTESMTVLVQQSSGDVDQWSSAHVTVDMELNGALIVLDEDNQIVGVYAPGMWMKVEFVR